MSEENEVDFGPLKALIGVWQGKDGIDIAPEPAPENTETNPYTETITFEIVGDLKNAKTQELVAISYHQVVKRTSNGEVFHDELGYWMWDKATSTIMNSITIPRAVTVLAGGTHDGAPDANGNTVIEVSANQTDPNWTIAESPFCQKNASTTSFTRKFVVGKDRLSYFQTTMLDIYGKTFEHTDENELVRVG